MESGPSRLLLLPVDPPQTAQLLSEPDEAVHAEPAIVFPAPPPRALRTPRRSPIEPVPLAIDDRAPRDVFVAAADATNAADEDEKAAADAHAPGSATAPVPVRQRVAAAVDPATADDGLWLAAEEVETEAEADVAPVRENTASHSPISGNSEPARGVQREPASRPQEAADSPESIPARSPARRRRDATAQAASPALADSSAKAAEGAEPTEVHFGTLLRRARERHGLTLNDVADRTRISPRWIRALEDAQLDILPAPVFVSGYLRTYARLVGLDGQDLLARYQTLSRKRAQALAPTERGFKVRRHGQPVQVPAWLIAALLSGVTVIVLGVLWLTNTLWRR